MEGIGGNSAIKIGLKKLSLTVHGLIFERAVLSEG